MTVYVDALRSYPKAAIKPAARRHGATWCHMATDGDAEELHLLAERIGLRRAWYQVGSTPHYDLIPSKRALAIRAGAVPVTSRELVRRCKREREATP